MTFMDDYQAGHTTAENLDHYVAAWFKDKLHDMAITVQSGAPNNIPDLAPYLGMTTDEYATLMRTKRMPERSGT